MTATQVHNAVLTLVSVILLFHRELQCTCCRISYNDLVMSYANRV